MSGPIGTPPTRTVLRLVWLSADTSLYGAVIRLVSATPGRPGDVEGLQHRLGADHADDGAGDTAADEGLAAVPLDVADHRVDVGLGCGRGHHDHHAAKPSPAPAAASPLQLEGLDHGQDDLGAFGHLRAGGRVHADHRVEEAAEGAS